MNRERELLERSVRIIESLGPDYEAYNLIDKIGELLAQPEAVAWMWEQQSPHSGEWDSEFAEGKPQNFRVIRNIRPLYTSPPKRESLSGEQVCEILIKKEWKGFVELVRQIEKAHGIGGD